MVSTKPTGGGVTHSRLSVNVLRKTGKDLLQVVGLTSAILIATTTNSFAEDSIDKKTSLYVGATFCAGFGLKDEKIGTATDGSDITLSAGGGVGGALYLGYSINPTIDVEVAVGVCVDEKNCSPET